MANFTDGGLKEKDETMRGSLTPRAGESERVIGNDYHTKMEFE